MRGTSGDAKRDTFFPLSVRHRQSSVHTHTVDSGVRSFTISSTFFGRVVAYVDQRLSGVSQREGWGEGGVFTARSPNKEATTRIYTRISFSGEREREAYDAVAPAVGTRNCVVRIRIVGGKREGEGTERERERERVGRKRETSRACMFLREEERGREKDRVERTNVCGEGVCGLNGGRI